MSCDKQAVHYFIQLGRIDIMAEPLVKQDTITSWYLNRTPVKEYFEKKSKKNNLEKTNWEIQIIFHSKD